MDSSVRYTDPALLAELRAPRLAGIATHAKERDSVSGALERSPEHSRHAQGDRLHFQRNPPNGQEHAANIHSVPQRQAIRHQHDGNAEVEGRLAQVPGHSGAYQREDGGDSQGEISQSR